MRAGYLKKSIISTSFAFKETILLNKSLARVNKIFFYLSKWFNDIKYLLK